MDDLYSYSIEELEEEIERRKKEEEEKPITLPNPDFSRVIDYAKEYVDTISTTGYEPKDYQEYFYELVMFAAFGPDIFDWINGKL